MLMLVAGNAVLIGAMWLRHGGLEQTGSVGGMATAAGQLTALFGTFAALLELVLLSRAPWLDHHVGTDRLIGWHRWVGFATVWLISAHLVFTTIGWAATAGRGAVDEFVSMLMNEPYVLMAAVGFILFVAVGLSSMRWVRNRLSYETWYGVHLYAYIGIALAFLHALFVGNDFLVDPVATGLLAGPVRRRVRTHPRLPSRQSHRCSISGTAWSSRTSRPRRRGSCPSTSAVATLMRCRPEPASSSSGASSPAAAGGEHTRTRYRRCPMGGTFASPSRARESTLTWRSDCIPACASSPRGLTERSRQTDSPAPPRSSSRVASASRRCARCSTSCRSTTGKSSSSTAPPHGRTSPSAASSMPSPSQRRVRVVYLVGRRGDPALQGEPLSPESISNLVPDVGVRDVFVSGSEGFISHVRSSLRKLGLQGDQVHAERFAF